MTRVKSGDYRQQSTCRKPHIKYNTGTFKLRYPSLKASNAKQNKVLNLRLVMSEVATRSPVSRAEIARATGLTRQTITNMMDELLDAGLVVETGFKKDGGVGKPSKMLALADTGTYCAGIRVFPDHCQMVIYNLINEKIGQCQIERQPILNNGLKDALQDLLSQLALEFESLLGVGLSFADHFDEQYPDHASRQDFANTLSHELKQPVILETTAAACAAYHMLHGEAKALNSFIYIHIGPQIESAVVYGRRIILGHNKLTGALGDIFVSSGTDDKDGELLRLNSFASLDAFYSCVKRPFGNRASLGNLIEQQPQVIERWLDQAAEPMRIAIHMLESTINSQSIIFGGDITPKILDLLIARLRPLIPSIADFGERKVPRVIQTPDVSEIALRGIATLPLHSALDIEQPYSASLPSATELSNRQALLFML